MNITKFKAFMSRPYAGRFLCQKNDVVIHCHDYVRSVFWKAFGMYIAAFVLTALMAVFLQGQAWFSISYFVIAFILSCWVIMYYYISRLKKIKCPICGSDYTFYFKTKENVFDMAEEEKLEIECKFCRNRFETDCEFALLMGMPQKRDL